MVGDSEQSSERSAVNYLSWSLKRSSLALMMLDDAENQSYGSRRLAIICVAPWMLLLMEKGRSSCNSGSLTESCVRADGVG